MNSKSVTIWNKNYILCMLISTTAAIGHGMLNPSLPLYAASLGIATDAVGIVIGIAMVLCMFGRGWVGGQADRMSKKFLVKLSLLIMLSGYLLFFTANNIGLLLIAKSLQAVGHGMTNTVLSTLAFSSVPQEKLASGVGMFSLASSLAQCFAPNIGTEIAYSGNFPLLFLSAVIMTAVSILLLGKVEVGGAGDVKRKQRGAGFQFNNYISLAAVPAAIMLLFNGLVYSSIANYLPMYGLDRGLSGVGIFFSINSATMLLTRPLTGKICDKRPLAYIMVPGYIAQVCACLLISAAQSMPCIYLAGVLYGAGFGSTQAAIQIMALRSVNPEERGKANGTFYVGGDIGLSGGAMAAGIMAQRFGYTLMYQIMAVVSAICLMFYFGYKKYKKNGGKKHGKTKRDAVLSE